MDIRFGNVSIFITYRTTQQHTTAYKPHNIDVRLSYQYIFLLIGLFEFGLPFEASAKEGVWNLNLIYLLTHDYISHIVNSIL